MKREENLVIKATREGFIDWSSIERKLSIKFCAECKLCCEGSPYEVGKESDGSPIYWNPAEAEYYMTGSIESEWNERRLPVRKYMCNDHATMICEDDDADFRGKFRAIGQSKLEGFVV